MSTQINRIILVDDDEDDRFLFAEAFEDLKIGAELLLFEDGHRLIEHLTEIDDYVSTYIFLDLNMPLLSGMDCLKMLRKKMNLNDLFVTIYSTSSSQRDIDAAYTNGANGYLQKPTNFNKLKDLIHKAISTGNTSSGKQLTKAEFILNN